MKYDYFIYHDPCSSIIKKNKHINVDQYDLWGILYQ